MVQYPNTVPQQADKRVAADGAISRAPLDWDLQCPGAPLLKPGDFQEPLPMSDRELFGLEDDLNISIDSNNDSESRLQRIA